jgi:hypothetical protein
MQLYKSYSGKKVINTDKQIEVKFIGDGARKISHGGNIYAKKVALLEHLESIITEMIYNNFGEAKRTDKITVLGYLNFKISVRINGKTEKLRIAIQLRNDGSFYYNHEVNMI